MHPGKFSIHAKNVKIELYLNNFYKLYNIELNHCSTGFKNIDSPIVMTISMPKNPISGKLVKPDFI